MRLTRLLRPTLLFTLALMLATALTPETALAGSLGDFNALVKRGHHDDSGYPFGLRALCLSVRTDRTQTFRVQFTPSCRYRTTAAQNQLDWCKLMGFTTVDIHKHSIRLGWRYNPQTDKIDLGYYGYIKGNRTMQALTSIDVGAWASVTIRMHRNGEMVEVNGVRHEVSQALGLSSLFPTPTWVLRTAYFGGDEEAPQDISIVVRDIQVN